LLKARALSVHSRPQDQRHDLVTLLSMLDDPRAALATISAKEGRWLRPIADRLAIDDPMSRRPSSTPVCAPHVRPTDS
jgi:hypothetical protein